MLFGATGAAGTAGTVRVEVADTSCRPPQQRHAEGEDTGGRGLELVDGLADRWGWQPEGAGKRIWCEVDRGAPVVQMQAGAHGPGMPGIGAQSAGPYEPSRAVTHRA
jgi:hypothetical protein